LEERAFARGGLGMTEKRNEKRRNWVAFDRKSPPFPQKARKGWGTLKFERREALERGWGKQQID
jgi:hypothetical protein